MLMVAHQVVEKSALENGRQSKMLALLAIPKRDVCLFKDHKFKKITNPGQRFVGDLQRVLEDGGATRKEIKERTGSLYCLTVYPYAFEAVLRDLEFQKKNRNELWEILDYMGIIQLLSAPRAMSGTWSKKNQIPQLRELVEKLLPNKPPTKTELRALKAHANKVRFFFSNRVFFHGFFFCHVLTFFS